MSDTNVQSDSVLDPAFIAETQEDAVTESPVSTENGHDDIANKEQPAETVKTESAEETARKREQGKLQQVQKELTEYKQKFEAVEGWVKSDPDLYKKGLIATSGYSEAEVDSYINKLKTDGLWNTTTNAPTANSGAPVVDAQNIEVLVEKLLTEREQQRNTEAKLEAFKVEQGNAFNALNQAFPETSRESVTALDESVQNEMIQKVSNADILAQTYMKIVPDMKYQDAVIKAYAEISGKTTEEIENARAQGRLQGMAQMAGQTAGAMPESRGESSTQSKASGLTEIERRVADSVGLSYEDFAKYGNDEEITLL